MLSITVTQTDLAKALASVKRAVPGKSSLPILTHVLLTAERRGTQQYISLRATDLDVTVEVPVGGKIDAPGALAVPFKALATVVQQTEGLLKLEGMGTKGSGKKAEQSPTLSVQTTGTFRVQLPALAATEFPSVPEVAGAKQDGAPYTVTLSGDAITQMARVTPFVSTEDSRPILSGVLVEFRRTETRAVATNGHRMAVARVPGHWELPSKTAKGVTTIDTPSAILPPLALEMAAALFARTDAVTVQWHPKGQHIRLANDWGQIWARLIEGPYPHYEQVIPRENDKVATFDSKPLLASLKRLKPFTNTNTRRLRFDLSPAGIAIQAKTPDLGIADDVLPGSYEGEPMQIGLNLDYLEGCVRALDTEAVSLSLKAPERATTLHGISEGVVDRSFMLLLMPLRLVD
jgi:DNA polymerase-3 subunit beta